MIRVYSRMKQNDTLVCNCTAKQTISDQLPFAIADFLQSLAALFARLDHDLWTARRSRRTRFTSRALSDRDGDPGVVSSRPTSCSSRWRRVCCIVVDNDAIDTAVVPAERKEYRTVTVLPAVWAISVFFFCQFVADCRWRNDNWTAARAIYLWCIQCTLCYFITTNGKKKLTLSQ